MPDKTPLKNIFLAWDRMNGIWFRYWTYYEEKGKTLKTDKEREEHQARFRREVHFVIRSTSDLEFHQYLNNRLDYTRERGRPEGLVVRRHMKELAKFVILDMALKKSRKFETARDILPPKSTDLPWTDVVEGDEDDGKHERSYWHLLRMVNEYYPELLSTRTELKNRMGKRKISDGRKIEDRRGRIIETLFSRDEKLPKGIFDLVVARALREDATTSFLDEMHSQSVEVIKATICDPIDLAKLTLFRDDVVFLMRELRVNPFVELIQQIQDFKGFEVSAIFSILIQMLFLQLRALEELRWFRSKSERIQNSLIFRDPRIPRYSRQDAKRAVSLSYRWFRNPLPVTQLMAVAARAHVEYMAVPLHQVGVWLMEECMIQLDFSNDFKGLICHNIAIAYQAQGKSRLMMRWLNKSLNLFKSISGHPGDIADIHAYIAEYWRKKNASKYKFHRETAEILIQSPELATRRKAYHYLAVANCAILFSDRDWEKRLYEQGLRVTSKDYSLEDYSSFFHQCLTDLENFGRRGPDGGPGRVPAPKEFAEGVMSPSFFGIVVDSDGGN